MHLPLVRAAQRAAPVKRLVPPGALRAPRASLPILPPLAMSGGDITGGGANGGGGGGGGGSNGPWPPDGEDDNVQRPSPLALALAVAAVGAASTPWVRRGTHFWLGAAPILISYLLLALSCKLDGADEAARRSRLADHHEACAPRALRLVQSMAGGYIKMGQVLSNRADVLPEPYVRAFGTLHDSVPPRPWARMQRSLRRDAPRLVNLLEWVDPTPLGAASTGQVHRARLLNGSDVVLKLQYSDMRAHFGADLGNVARVARLALPALAPVVQEVRRRFRGEFDYAREARDQADVRHASMVRHPRTLVIPQADLELSTERVLVMEYLEGEKLLSHVQGKLRSALGDAGYTWVRARAMGVAPPPGAAKPRLRRRLVAAPALWRLRRRTRTRLRLLASLLGEQMLIDGCFHADPHPGNVLLMPDGKLGLIDFGQTVRLDDEQRRRLACLIVALGATHTAGPTARTDERVAAAASDLGFATRRNSTEGLSATAAFFFDVDPPVINGKRRSPAQTLLHLNELDPLVHVPEAYILAARVSLLMRGTSQLMAQQSLSIATLWRREAEAALGELGGGSQARHGPRATRPGPGSPLHPAILSAGRM